MANPNIEAEKRRREEAEAQANQEADTAAAEEERAKAIARQLEANQAYEAFYDKMFGIDDKKVYLTGIAEEELGDEKGGSSGTVPFNVQPVISETGSALYSEINDIRQAGSIMIYMGSPGREFSINATFISRTQSEANLNRQYMQYLRSWRMPEKTGSDFAVRSPSRLRLTGFGKWLGSTTSITQGIPVRMMSLSIEMPDDTDYIMTYDTYFVPIVWKVSMSLKETRSDTELKEFNITTFRKGQLDGW